LGKSLNTLNILNILNVSWKPCPLRNFGQKPEHPEHPEHPQLPRVTFLTLEKSLGKSLNSLNILNILKLPRVTFRSMRKFGQKLEHPEHGRRAADKNHGICYKFAKNPEHREHPGNATCHFFAL
jgi:hypothetical protein